MRTDDGEPRADALLTTIGDYELQRLIAQGGMADVYLARRAGTLDRQVAVKVLAPERACDPEARALFLDEARLLALLAHPNLATVFDVDFSGGVHYLAMESVHGADLRELLAAAQRAEAAIPYDAAIAIVAAAAAGLDHAHRRCGPDGKPLRLVHRDVSLSNIMVGHDGSVKVVDFGIATASISAHVTNPGVVRGKASYMSPEQCLGDPVDLRTDVFALGIVLYELTTGRRCFAGNTDFERMLAIVRGDYVRPTAFIADYPLGLEAIVETALALDPEQRFASAAAMMEALERVALAEGWLAGPSTIARLMHELFDAVAEPTAPAACDDTDLAAPLPLPRPDPTVVITRPRRFPRGTECDSVVRAPDGEDEPTRGRRSMPRLWGRAGSQHEPLAA